MWPAVILKCQNHLVHFILIIIRYYVIKLMNFSFKMPWRYVKQVAAPNMALYTSIILKKNTIKYCFYEVAYPFDLFDEQRCKNKRPSWVVEEYTLTRSNFLILNCSGLYISLYIIGRKNMSILLHMSGLSFCGLWAWDIIGPGLHVRDLYYFI
jgi:hypothetical protein